MKILRLKEILSEKNIQNKELAKAVNVTETSISNLTKGNSIPRKDLLIKIAKYLDVDIKDLFHSSKSDKKKIQLIIDDKLHTFYSVEEFKAFAGEI